MPLKIPGFELVDAKKPAAQTGSPREKFRRGVEYQIALLGGLKEFKGKELVDSQGKLKVRRWYWQRGEQYLSEIKYGNISLLEEGKAYTLPNKEALEEFYQRLKDECDKGTFDDEIGKAVDRMPRTGRRPAARKGVRPAPVKP